MAKKKTTYKDTSEKEIERMLAEKREALRAFRFGTAGSKARNVKEAKMIRRDIARILTEVSKRKLNAQA